MIGTIALGVLLTIILYVLYVLVMYWKRKKEEQGDKLTPRQWMIAGPLVALGYPVDIFYNVVFPAPLVLWDWPRELTLTSRFQRYLDNPEEAGWRYHVALWWKPRLNKHDEDHLE